MMSVEVDKVQKILINQSGGRIIGYSENEVYFRQGQRPIIKMNLRKLFLTTMSRNSGKF